MHTAAIVCLFCSGWNKTVAEIGICFVEVSTVVAAVAVAGAADCFADIWLSCESK